jgi:hypothetical protein
MFDIRREGARFAARFVQNPKPFNAYPAINRFAHIVNR